MPLKPAYLLLAGGGAIVAYSGIKGKGIGSAIRDVLTGQNPAHALSANGITASSSITGTTPGNAPIGGLVFTGAGASERAYFAAMLKDLGAPVTNANLTTMYTWAKQEEPSWPVPNSWNPLNVKNPVTGSFWQWDSPTVGAGGTAQFMVNNNYGAIVAALRSGKGLIGNTDPQVAAELSAWSGGGYSAIGQGG